MVRKQDQIRGCLLGQAAGDALGYCVEELTLPQIQEKYGPEGIRGYDTVNGYAEVSSHTQLAMFTANGLLFGATRGAVRGRMAPYVKYVEMACRDWAKTQRYGGRRPDERVYSWLYALEPLRVRRCLDPAVLDALTRPGIGSIDEPVNRSQGCGGLTRAAPLGLFLDPAEVPRQETALLGAESAALTQGHPLGFLPGAYLTDLINRIVYDRPDSFRAVLKSTCAAMERQFGPRYPQTAAIREQLFRAEFLASTPAPPAECLERLSPAQAPGVLAAACYVCLKFPGDFDHGLVAAVNHSGASAAVGAVAGALLGAMVGTEGIPEFYLEPLELRGILEELADDLFQGCPMSRSARLFDDQWDQKYVQCTY